MKKRRFFKQILALLLCLVSLLFLMLPASAAEPTALPSMQEANAVYFYHIESDRVIASKNDAATLGAGSSIKIMSGLLACEMLTARRYETVTVTQQMVNGVWGHRLHLQAGDQLTVEQLLYAAVCGSYNDAFYVLAYTASGSLEGFVEQMNRRAREMGLENTYFTDPSGIDDSSVTTAQDIAKLALAAYQNPLYMQLCGTKKYTLPPNEANESRVIYNRNAMIASQTTNRYYNEKCIGMSAGSTNNGGHCVISLTQEKGETYLCVVLGARETEEGEYGYVIANRLSDWVYQTYSYTEILTPESVVCTIPVTVSDLLTEIKVSPKESLSVYLPAGVDPQKEIQYSIRLIYSELEAPVAAGLHVGYVAVIYQDRVVGTVPLYTAESAERSGFISSLKNIQSITKSRPILAGLIFFAVSLIAWITTETLVTRHRRHKWDRYFSQKMELPPDMLKTHKRKK